jgi:hypothetical protein
MNIFNRGLGAHSALLCWSKNAELRIMLVMCISGCCGSSAEHKCSSVGVKTKKNISRFRKNLPFYKKRFQIWVTTVFLSFPVILCPKRTFSKCSYTVFRQTIFTRNIFFRKCEKWIFANLFVYASLRKKKLYQGAGMVESFEQNLIYCLLYFLQKIRLFLPLYILIL